MNHYSYLTSLEITAQYFQDVRIDIVHFTILKKIRAFYGKYKEYRKQIDQLNRAFLSKKKSERELEIFFIQHTKMSKIMLEDLEYLIIIIEEEAEKLSHDCIPDIDILVSFIHSYRIIQKEIENKNTTILQHMSESLKEKILSKEIFTKAKQLKESMNHVAETLKKLSTLNKNISKKLDDEDLGIFNFNYSLSVPPLKEVKVSIEGKEQLEEHEKLSTLNKNINNKFDEKDLERLDSNYSLSASPPKEEKVHYGERDLEEHKHLKKLMYEHEKGISPDTKLKHIYDYIIYVCEELFKLLGHKSILIHSKENIPTSNNRWETDIYSDQFTFIEHINTIYNLSLLHMQLQDCALGTLSDSMSLLKETIECNEICTYLEFKYQFLYLMMKKFPIINNYLQEGKLEEISKELSTIGHDKKIKGSLYTQIVLYTVNSHLSRLKGPLKKVQYYELLAQILYTIYEVKIKEQLTMAVQRLFVFYDEYTLSEKDIRNIYGESANGIGNINYNQFTEMPIKYARKTRSLLNRSLAFSNELDVRGLEKQGELLYTRVLSLLRVLKKFHYILRNLIQVHGSKSYINTSFHGRDALVVILKDIDKELGRHSLFRKTGIFSQEKMLIKLQPLIAQIQREVVRKNKTIYDERMSA